MIHEYMWWVNINKEREGKGKQATGCKLTVLNADIAPQNTSFMITRDQEKETTCVSV